MGESEKSIRLVTALVECRPDGEYAPWDIKWYDGTVYPFDRIESYSSRSWALGRNRRSESWHVVVGDGTCRDICHYQNSWYAVHDPDDDTPAASHRKNSQNAHSKPNAQVNGLTQSRIRPQKDLHGYPLGVPVFRHLKSPLVASFFRLLSKK